MLFVNKLYVLSIFCVGFNLAGKINGDNVLCTINISGHPIMLGNHYTKGEKWVWTRLYKAKRNYRVLW